jgi:hypothetical protein
MDEIGRIQQSNSRVKRSEVDRSDFMSVPEDVKWGIIAMQPHGAQLLGGRLGDKGFEKIDKFASLCS